MLSSRLLFSLNLILLDLLLFGLGLALNLGNGALGAGSFILGVLVVLLVVLLRGSGLGTDLFILSLAHNLGGGGVNNFHLLLSNLSSPVVLDLVD